MSFRGLTTVGLLSGLALLGAASCVAQESYDPKPPSDGGAAGTKVGAGSAGLVITDPMGGGGASAGTASGGTPAAAGARTAECETSAQCALPFPYCLTSRGVCVECLSRSNCSGTGRSYCDLASNTCAACLMDEHCPHASPYCATSIGACVECLSNDNCGSANLVCDRASHHCVPTCRDNDDCSGNPATSLCDPESSLCVACLADQDCLADLPRCALDTKTCVGCLEDGDCAAPTSRCDLRAQKCVACVANQDCPPGAVCVAGICQQPK